MQFQARDLGLSGRGADDSGLIFFEDNKKPLKLKAADPSHEPAKHIEVTARSASSVETAKDVAGPTISHPILSSRSIVVSDTKNHLPPPRRCRPANVMRVQHCGEARKPIYDNAGVDESFRGSG
jgi:hypothetical protein